MNESAPQSTSQGVPGEGRFLAVVIGADDYSGTSYERLRFSVNDALSLATALRKTLPSERLRVSMITDVESDSSRRPTRKAILDLLGNVTGEAKKEDTLMVFFAGHGEVRGGRAFLIPEDVNPFSFEQTALEISALMAILDGSLARTKLFVLDACQTVETGEVEETRVAGVGFRGVRKRSIHPMSSSFLTGLAQQAGDSIVFASCSPGEQAAESPQEHHGAFSYFLARGLRGEADLDGDGEVNLAELIQYVTSKTADWARQRGESQTPHVIWRGRAMVPLTGRRVPLAQERRLAKPGTGFFRQWRECFRGGLSGASFEHPGKLVAGSGLLLASVYLSESLAYANKHGSVPVVVVGALLFLLAVVGWRALVAFCAASAKERWHGGGYFAGSLVMAWHVVVFALLGSCLALYGRPEFLRRDLVFIAVDLLLLACASVALGVNGVNFVLSLARLVSDGEQTLVREAFRSLDEKKVPMIPLPVACVSLPFSLYFVVFGMGSSAVVVVNSAMAFRDMMLGAIDVQLTVLILLRNFAVVAWVLWQLFWYQAELDHLRRTVFPEV